MTRKKSKMLKVFTFLVYILLWTPVLVVMLFSFSSNRFGVRWDEFTLKWYASLLNNQALRDALVRSLVIASITVVASCVFGTLGALGLYKLKFRGKQLLRTSLLVPIVLPSVVTGGALLVYFTRFAHIPLGYPSIILAHISFSVPLAVFIILGRMQRIDWAWEEAAMDLGASRFRVFQRVTGPILLPGIGAAGLVIFPWSFDDFVVTYFVQGIGTMTLPIYIFSQLRFGSSPVVNTVGAILITVTIGLLLAARALENKNKNF